MFGDKNPFIFGIPIEGPSLAELSSLVKKRTDEAKATWIVTANPEILLLANRDKTYADAIRNADVRTVDGFGLWLALRLMGHRATRLTGVDLSEALILQADREHQRVALIGGGPGVAQAAADRIKLQHPLLAIHAEQGGFIAKDGTDDDQGEEARHRLTLFDPQILLVAFGNPKQERWILRNAGEFPNLRLVMGIGGTLDFWAGNICRAPAWMQKIGLEWLWRLFVEPKRWRRIWNAVVVFPWIVFKTNCL